MLECKLFVFIDILCFNKVLRPSPILLDTLYLLLWGLATRLTECGMIQNHLIFGAEHGRSCVTGTTWYER